MADKKTLKCIVIGGGSIGERHIHNLKKIGLENIAVVDKNKKKIDKLSKKYSIKKFYNLNSAWSFEPDFSLICTWSDSHISLANSCIKNNSHVFIEKPISSNLVGVNQLLKKARSKKLKIAVGYNMRFEKGLTLLKEKLRHLEIGSPISIHSQWGNNISNWIHPDSKKNHYVLEKGGGVILDDSHEYDYIRWLLNDEVKSVYCQTNNSTKMKTKTDSLASIILKFKKGCVASLVIDFVRPTYERTCHIIGEKGDLKWNYLRGNPSKNFQTKANSTVTTRLLKNGKSCSKHFNLKVNDLYFSEINNFITSITGRTNPLVDGWDGFNTLKVGIAAIQSARKNKVIYL